VIRRLAGGLRRLRIAGLGVLLAASACETGPSGPGDLNATVESPLRTAGAAVVEVRGVGIRGFSATGLVQVYWARGTDPGSYRVVLVNPGSAAPLTFSIQVDDVSAPPPTGSALEAAALDNTPLLDPSDFELSIVP